MKVRKATYEDIDALMEIFEGAKRIMRASGNLHQWNDGYPSREVVMRDIEGGYCYVLSDAEVAGEAGETGRIIATMALIPGPDPTYSYIEGEWPGDEPYHAIHRIATATPGRNVGRILLDWAFEYIRKQGQSTIRIDTHRDNCIMKHMLTKYGFTMCGVIYLADGAPRDAYYLNIIA